MRKDQPLTVTDPSEAIRPWYREPWPWVLIALPLITIIACFVTLYLAISRPDYRVVDGPELERVQAELRAQPSSGYATARAATDDPDGER